MAGARLLLSAVRPVPSHWLARQDGHGHCPAQMNTAELQIKVVCLMNSYITALHSH